MNEGLKEHSVIILKEMCKRVGADFTTINFKYNYGWRIKE